MATTASSPYSLAAYAPSVDDTIETDSAAAAAAAGGIGDITGTSQIVGSISDLFSSGLQAYVTLDTIDEQVAIEQARSRAAQASSAASIAATTAAQASSLGNTIATNPLTSAAVILGALGLIAWAVKR